MANNYTQSSEYLEVKTQEELDWLKQQFEEVQLAADGTIYEFNDRDMLEADGELTTAVRFLAEAFLRKEVDDTDFLDDAGFQVRFDEDAAGDVTPPPVVEFPLCVWIYGEEGYNPENVGILVQQFLKKFSPKGWWTASWASTCSKLRVGEFSGGAMLVTADAIEIVDAQDWVWQKAKLLEKEGQR